MSCDPRNEAFDTCLDEIEKMHDALELEHRQLSATWFGGARRRHIQIMGASSALAHLHKIILKRRYPLITLPETTAAVQADRPSEGPGRSEPAGDSVRPE